MAKNTQFIIDIGQGLSMRIGPPAISTWDNATRPKNVIPGTLGFNTETKRLECWDGTDWLIARMSND